jgi:perosamine synthetase
MERLKMDPELVPFNGRTIPVSEPLLSKSAAELVADAIAANWISQGPYVERFEREFSEAHGRKFGVACCSGTSALWLALEALKWQGMLSREDLVAVPTLTMVAVPNAVLGVGCIPHLLESNERDGNLDLARVYSEIDGRSLIQCAIVPHLYGIPADAAVAKLVHTGELFIEDCAEAHYAKFADGSPIGSKGRMACFSFYANKIVTCGEGGMVLTDDAREADYLRSLRSHAFTPGNHFHHRGFAYGNRMTDLQAAVGVAQHHDHKTLLAMRAAVARLYLDRLADLEDCLTLPINGSIPGAVWWVFPIQIRDSFDSFDRDELRAYLGARGVETRTFFHPMHLQPHLQEFDYGDYPIAETLAMRGLYLPFFPHLSEASVEHVCDSIRRFFRR